MQKTITLFLVMCGQMYAMEKEQTQQRISIMVAAWVVTPDTPLNEKSEFRLFQFPNGSRKITYTSRPQGIFEKPCDVKTVLELPASSVIDIPIHLHSCTKDYLKLSAPQDVHWYKSSIVTHGAAVLSTILVMAALFH
ncbi:MAG: hypothetical protein AB7F19_04320 [Candidatus Babeliales bacterium]